MMYTYLQMRLPAVELGKELLLLGEWNSKEES